MERVGFQMILSLSHVRRRSLFVLSPGNGEIELSRFPLTFIGHSWSEFENSELVWIPSSEISLEV